MYDPQVIYEALVKTGDDWADKKAAFMALDDLTKTVLSDAIGKMKGSSAAEREAQARASESFTNHLVTLGEARRAWLFAEVKYKSTQALADGRKTEESTRRMEANYTGLQK